MRNTTCIGMFTRRKSRVVSCCGYPRSFLVGRTFHNPAGWRRSSGSQAIGRRRTLLPRALSNGRLGIEVRYVEVTSRHDCHAVGTRKLDRRVLGRLSNGDLHSNDAAIPPDPVNARKILIGTATAEHHNEQHFGLEVGGNIQELDAGQGRFVPHHELHLAEFVRMGAGELTEDRQFLSIGW